MRQAGLGLLVALLAVALLLELQPVRGYNQVAGDVGHAAAGIAGTTRTTGCLRRLLIRNLH